MTSRGDFIINDFKYSVYTVVQQFNSMLKWRFCRRADGGGLGKQERGISSF